MAGMPGNRPLTGEAIPSSAADGGGPDAEIGDGFDLTGDFSTS